MRKLRSLISSRVARYALVATFAFVFGGASFAAGGPVVSGFVTLIDGTNTAAINGARELSVADAGVNMRLAAIQAAGAGAQAYQLFVPLVFAGNDFSTESTRSVPAGKRLVIEFVSGEFTVGTGQVVGFFFVETTVNGQTATFTVPIQHTMTFSNGNEGFAASQQMRLYADPGTTVAFRLTRNMAVASSGGGGFLGVSGYYVDVP